MLFIYILQEKMLNYEYITTDFKLHLFFHVRENRLSHPQYFLDGQFWHPG